MKVVRIVNPGSFDSLELRSEDIPMPGPRDVVMRVHAASLNFRDLIIATGHYPGPLRSNGIPLSDGAGEVVAVGRDVTRAKVGDRVTANCNVDWIGGPFSESYHPTSIGMTIDGMLAEYGCFHENALIKLPDYLSYEEAASMPCAAVSAWSALTYGDPLGPGQTVLIQGTGGVSLFGLQIARMFGARVLAITSSAEKARKLEALGAAAVINYRETPNWSDEILNLTGGTGVDKVVEIGGESTIQQAIACTRIGGQLGLVGFVSGFGGGIPPLDIMKRSVNLRGISIGPRLSFEALLTAMGEHNVRPVIDKVFPFAEYKAAYRHLKSATHVGKVVIKIASS